MLTSRQIEELRDKLAGAGDGGLPAEGALDRATLEALLDQAEYALDAAALLHELEYHPAEPYTEAAELAVRIADGVNDLWNKHRHRRRPDSQ